MHARIVLFDGFDPLDVIAPHEVAERLPASKVTGQRRTILAATEHRP
jgi:hypothetical protein